MKYQDSVEKSTEFLRLALPLMSKQTAALTPISYAVWYEYVAGINTPLREHIAALTASGNVLDEAATIELYRKHIVELDEELAQRISLGLQKVMADMTQSAAQAGNQAGQFGEALEQWSAGLQDAQPDVSALQAGLPALLRNTRDTQQSIATLNERLEHSRRETERLRQEVIRVRQDALADGLTGLTNRKGFDLALASCLAATGPAARGAGPCLLMADIDHFKQVNDSYGHVFGDKVIRTIAEVLKQSTGNQHTAARYGGEEFVILMPETPLDDAHSLAQSIRTMVEKCRIKRSDNNKTIAKITVSVGVTCHRAGESGSEFVARADSALYASKHNGRNCVTAI